MQLILHRHDKQKFLNKKLKTQTRFYLCKVFQTMYTNRSGRTLMAEEIQVPSHYTHEHCYHLYYY